LYRLFFNLYQGLIALFFIFLGLVAIILPWYMPLQEFIQEAIVEYPQSLLIIGIVLFTIGMGIILYLSMSSKKQHLKFVSGKFATTIDQGIVEDYLRIYWNKLYPNEEILSRAEIKKETIYLYAELPKPPEEHEKALITQIEEDITEQFFTTLGYRNPVHFSITFNQDITTS